MTRLKRFEKEIIEVFNGATYLSVEEKAYVLEFLSVRISAEVDVLSNNIQQNAEHVDNTIVEDESNV